ncbi:MAG: nucleotide pyrophosphohydrolase [Candidatus Aenigmarchaeota archaeon]|nr:nucleotide pyrophosphohydrolase [Candidatus Aenigmarchaeota archaeon]
MEDDTTNITKLKILVKEFCEKRDWDQYHNPKDLSIGIVTEASELLQHFRFKNEEQIKNMLDDEKKNEEITDEVADILYFLLRLAQMYEIDLSTVLKRKLEKNEQRYPVDKVKGLNKKYSEY